MPSTTTRFGFRVPLLTEAADGPLGIGNLASDIDVRMPRGHMEGVGVLGYEDFRTKQDTGSNMAVIVQAGDANIRLADGSGHRRLRLAANSSSGIVGAPNTPTWTATFTTANGSNPRIDRVVLRQSYTVAGDLTLDVIAGTATAAATLVNLNGAAAIPAGVIHLADVLIPTSATAVTNANIQDRRPFGIRGVIPPVGAAVKLDMVTFEPHPALAMAIQHNTYPLIRHTLHDTRQGAALMYLPRRIVSATRIKWKFIQSTTALAGNYVIAIFDASGRRIVDTGTVAWTGTANNAIERSETITATTFEAGWYYPFMAIDTTTGDALAWGANMGGDAVVGPGVNAPNVALFVTSGGVTVPTQINNFFELSSQGAGVQGCPVPVFTLSVG